MEETLFDVPVGATATVKRIRATGEVGRRLREMGILPGSVVTVSRVATLGDPIEIRIRGYRLSLRKQEAEGILVAASGAKDSLVESDNG